MIRNLFSSFLIAIILFTSCENDTSTMLLPSITGKAGEVLIVIDKSIWDGEVGEKVKTILLDEYPSLPIAEPLFDPINIPHQAFNNMFKTHRNVLMTKVGSQYENKIIVKNDVWGETQLIITLTAKNNDELLKLLDENKESIVYTIEEKERERIIKNYKQYQETSIVESLKKNQQISLYIPSGYTIDREADDFVWIAHETPMISQGIFVYFYNYVDSNTFTQEYLVKKRDEFLKKYVPGPSDGSYMITGKIMQPTFKEFSLNEKYAVEMRGLWDVENDYYGGGPFISFTTLDEARQRVITVEGFVYAPQYSKRNYLRQVEAILYTLRIVE